MEIILLLWLYAQFSNADEVDSYEKSVAFTQEPGIWSLRCFYAGAENCRNTLSDNNLFFENVTNADIETTFVKMEQSIQGAFIKRDLSHLSNEEACSIPEPLLLLLPADYLSTLRGELLGRLLECHANQLSVARLISSAVHLVTSPYPFYSEIQSMKLNENVLSIIAEKIKSMNSIPSILLVSQHASILEYLKPDLIFEGGDKMMHFMIDMDPVSWSRRSSKIKRIWAFALSHTQNLDEWDDSKFLSWGHFLSGSTIDELEKLSPDLIDNKARFFQHPFSVLQMRGVFEDFYKYEALNSIDYVQVKDKIHQLLPKHLQQFNEGSLDYFNHTSLSVPTSLANSLQIVEYIVYNSGNGSLKNLLSTKEGLMSLNQLLYSVPLSYFKHLNYNMNFNEILQLQHPFLSMGQMFYLTERGNAFKLSINGIHNAHDILRGLPTQLLSEALPPSVIGFLASELPGNIPPRTASLLDNFLFKSGSEKNFKSLLKNKYAVDYFNFMPSKYIQINSKNIINALENKLKLHPDLGYEIPEHLASVLLTSLTNRALSWDIFVYNKDSVVFPILLRGVTCSDLNKLSQFHFINAISSYNAVRRRLGLAFPIELKQCCLKRFVEYLAMKSTFAMHYLSTSLITLMTASDMESVGGLVLAQLPLSEMRAAPERNLLIKMIGELSLPELLLSASASDLMNIGELYFQPKLGTELFNLGNLTAFLSATNVNTLNPFDFKLMLESGYLDKRVCAMDAQRDSWANLILEAFGPSDKWEAQDLMTIGDLLLVISHHNLSKVQPRVWSDVADLLASSTGYFETVDYLGKPHTFYELCEKRFQDMYEATTYRSELREYVGWLLTGAQYQLDTVVNSTMLIQGVRSNPVSKPRTAEPEFDVDESNETRLWVSFTSSLPSLGDSNKGSFATKITCDAIRVVGKPAEMFLTTSVIADMTSEDVENCKEIFGTMDLPSEVGMSIWSKLDKLQAPHLAGKLLTHASPVDVSNWNLSFDEKWSHETLFFLANFNNDKDTQSAVLSSLNSQKIDLLSLEQVVSLGPLVCQLPNARLTPNVFFKASKYLGSTLPCELYCLEYFAGFFENVDAYGPMSEWTPEDVESLGILIAGLDLERWTFLITENPGAFSRFGTRALECIPNRYIEEFTETVIEELPLPTATLLATEFSFSLNSTVKEALVNRTIDFKIDYLTPQFQEIAYVWEDDRYVPKIVENCSPAIKIYFAVLWLALLFVLT